MTSDERLLWTRLRETGEASVRNLLVERHLPLVRWVAGKVEAQTGVRFEELFSVGMVGLLQAVERFDLARGCRFATLAVHRIRGAMLDHLRREDGVTRRVAKVRRRCGATRQKLEHRLGRTVTGPEIAREMGMSIARYHAWEQESERTTVALTMDLPLPEAEPTDSELPEWLQARLLTLSRCEQKVIDLIFYQQLPGQEIARALGVSASRVSQIKSHALSQLRLGDPSLRSA